MKELGCICMRGLQQARSSQTLLHNQRALTIRAAPLFKPGVIVTAMPYHLER